MLYILSGTSRSGKTIVAKGFLKKTGIPYMSVDSIMMGFTNGIPEYGIHDRLWPNEIAEKMWPFLKAMCENMIWQEVDFVLEGEAFLPHLVRELLDNHQDKVQVAFMGYANSDLEEKVNDVKAHSSGVGDWLINEPNDYIESHIKNMIDYSEMIKSECTKHAVPYFDTSKDFESSTHAVLNSFTA
ncbi:MAG: hypothetical protein V7744_11895 [Pseudomonadales bacterium]